MEFSILWETMLHQWIGCPVGRPFNYLVCHDEAEVTPLFRVLGILVLCNPQAIAQDLSVHPAYHSHSLAILAIVSRGTPWMDPNVPSQTIS